MLPTSLVIKDAGICQRLIVRQLIFITTLIVVSSASANEPQIDHPQVLLRGISYDIALKLDEPAENRPELRIDDVIYHAEDDEGNLVYRDIVASGGSSIQMVLHDGTTAISHVDLPVIPAWISILPPLIAIGVALLTRSVLPALLLGLWIGAWALEGMTWDGVFYGLFTSVEVYVANALANPDHITIMIFTFMIAGTVGIISRNGGMLGIVNLIIKGADNSKRGQLAIWSLGLVIFFDDYANTLVVGNTSRSVSDRLRISREKLAYIVDSTAAPIATIALITTWIGYQVSLIGDAVAELDDLSMSAYSIFLNSILYSFYPFMAMLLVLLVITTGREFGPMLKAERRARSTGITASPSKSVAGRSEDISLEMKTGVPPRSINALLPITVMTASIIGGLFITGDGSKLNDIIGSADSYRALMWASLLSAFTAVMMTSCQRLLSLEEIVDAWVSGARFTFVAMIILVLAWSMSEVSSELHTVSFLIAGLGEKLPAPMVPSIVFVLAAFTAFSTGSSWGAMGILMPLVLPLSWAIMNATGSAEPQDFHLLYSSVSAVLAGAVWGDHCSPISDTTVLSSLSAGCNHMEHVRTQLPYAMLAGGAALLFGTIPTSFGLPWWLGMFAAAAITSISLRILGQQVEEYHSQ